ncbi:MAG TPA: hypothetical protein VJ499_07305 [Flavisolibacter sp.]|nr:hypothetical protein [Flavisolibacter sp.]
MTRMNICIRNLFVYFESVLHPAGGAPDKQPVKKKRTTIDATYLSQPSPDGYNMRAVAKKQDKVRRNPAP